MQNTENYCVGDVVEYVILDFSVGKTSDQTGESFNITALISG